MSPTALLRLPLKVIPGEESVVIWVFVLVLVLVFVVVLVAVAVPDAVLVVDGFSSAEAPPCFPQLLTDESMSAMIVLQIKTSR